MNSATSAVAERILAGLNPQQARAVEHVNGPLLLIAGAGSGKTRVLVHRAAYLIGMGHARAEQILAVTFTNKSAREMSERVASFLGPAGRGIWVSTFHSACTRMLRAHGDRIGLNKHFTIFDADDQAKVLRQVLETLDIDADKYKPSAVLGQIERAKQIYHGPEKYTDAEDYSGLPFGRVYRAYQQALREQDALDFSDLLFECVRLLQTVPDVLAMYHDTLRYVMIDEYQDTNHLQYLWTSLLAKSHGNLCVVGDEDQSIYSWRGADIRNIQEFKRDFPGAVEIKLEQNYRSTQTILSASNAVIARNVARNPKTLWTDNGQGARIVLKGLANEYDEARFALDWLLSATSREQLNERAIFYRTNAQSRVLEEECIKRRITYRIYGGVSFYSRKEVKDVLAYLRFALNPRDAVSLERILDAPKKGIGKTSLDKIKALASAVGGNLLRALEIAGGGDALGAAVRPKVRDLHQLLSRFAESSGNESVSQFAHSVLQQSGYLDDLKREDSEEARNRIDNLDELLSAMEQFEQGSEDSSLQSYLNSVALISDLDAETDGPTLSLMTLHMAKGLEFERVAIVGAEEEILPSARSLADNPVQGIEEERRLCYVGITRARRELAVTYAQQRRIWGQLRPGTLSRFVRDIPAELLDNRTEGGSLFAHTPSNAELPWNYRLPSRSAASLQRSSPPPATAAPRSSAAPALATSAAAPTNSLDGWTVGQRVRHPTLGIGVIARVEPSSVGAKLSIRFPNGDKVILPKYVALERIG